MKVAVVVPSYNESASAIVNTINSVLAQDYPIHEIFFVDDGSKDKSAYEVALKMREELLRTQREIAATTKNICSEILGIPDLIVHRLPKNCGKDMLNYGLLNGQQQMLLLPLIQMVICSQMLLESY